MKRSAIALLGLFVVSSSLMNSPTANAETTQIVCIGHRFERADNGRTIDFNTGNVVIGLDDASNEVRVLSSGSAVLYPISMNGVQVGAPQVSRYDKTEVDFAVTHNAPNYTDTDIVTINRITGQFYVRVTHSGGSDQQYDGTCIKAEQKF